MFWRTLFCSPCHVSNPPVLAIPPVTTSPPMAVEHLPWHSHRSTSQVPQNTDRAQLCSITHSHTHTRDFKSILISSPLPIIFVCQDLYPLLDLVCMTLLVFWINPLIFCLYLARPYACPRIMIFGLSLYCVCLDLIKLISFTLCMFSGSGVHSNSLLLDWDV